MSPTRSGQVSTQDCTSFITVEPEHPQHTVNAQKHLSVVMPMLGVMVMVVVVVMW